MSDRRQLQERRFAHEADNARLVQERDQARLEHKCSEATLAMAVARLGGKVEGHPTHRINFLQRIDELRRIEEERDEARQALREMEDAHSEETGERCRAEDERDLAVKAAAEADAKRERREEQVRVELREKIAKALETRALASSVRTTAGVLERYAARIRAGEFG